MKITILSAWKQEKILGTKEEDYLKRLSRDAKVGIEEIKGEKGDDRESLKREGKRLISRIGSSSFTVALTERGKLFDSPEFSKWIEKLALQGRSDVTFVVGSASGIDESVIERADMQLSLSPMTLPHQMARLVLIEQIYRAFTIIKGGPYHK